MIHQVFPLTPNATKPGDPSPSAFVEVNCTITGPDGQKYEAGGSVVSPDRIVAYPDKDGVLKTWHGQVIGTWRSTSSWPVNSWVGSRMHQIVARAQLDGKWYEYTGRGFGVGMIFKGKRTAANRKKKENS